MLKSARYFVFINMEYENIENLFETSDFGLAVVIYTHYPIWGIGNHYRDMGKKIFYFKRESGLDEFVQAYWRGEIKVEPRDYESKRKELKTQIHHKQNDINYD
jgi:hypothetical protein